MASVNSINSVNLQQTQGVKNSNNLKNISYKASQIQAPDTVEISNRINPPQIGTFRLMFNRLTDEQIDAVNKTRMLPDNAKFVMNGYGSYSICNNFLNIRVGTQTLPAGFEVRKDVLGFTTVLPVGSDGLFIK